MAHSLIDPLTDARTVELELLDGLSHAQMLGTRGHFLEPPIWEMGHVGWFQEYWLLRRVDRGPSLVRGADGMYDSFKVSYTRRWEHSYPSRRETLVYITDVLGRASARLEGREATADDRYFYTLAALHEDMHAENLTLIRHARLRSAPALGRAARPDQPRP
jgi:iron(II)-dependent oxidoreductase